MAGIFFLNFLLVLGCTVFCNREDLDYTLVITPGILLGAWNALTQQFHVTPYKHERWSPLKAVVKGRLHVLSPSPISEKKVTCTLRRDESGRSERRVVRQREN